MKDVALDVKNRIIVGRVLDNMYISNFIYGKNVILIDQKNQELWEITKQFYHSIVNVYQSLSQEEKTTLGNFYQENTFSFISERNIGCHGNTFSLQYQEKLSIFKMIIDTQTLNMDKSVFFNFNFGKYKKFQKSFYEWFSKLQTLNCKTVKEQSETCFIELEKAKR